jgi:integral membrane protein (TIGR01906 family)
MKKERRWYTALLTVSLILLILSGSIAVPLLCRPFYYAHIQALQLPEQTGYTAAQIREAFDEMMDFCLYDAPFGTGDLKWSLSGMEHFADCAVLFRLDLHVLWISAALLVVCAALYATGFRPVLLKGRGPCFWAGSVLAASFLIIAGLAAMDFDRAFVTFHHLFFPGKSNWIFDPRVDEIINVLPEVFFMNCAILIVVIMFVLCAVAILFDLFRHRNYRNH